MRDITDAEAALLGLLAEDEAHPYQLEKAARERDMRSWTDLSMSAIYKLLRKLEKGGFAASKVGLSDEHRARRVYRITEQGRDALANHLMSILSEPEWPKWRVDIAAYFLDAIPQEEVHICMEQYRRKLKRRIEDYKLLEEYMTTHGCAWQRLEIPRRTVCLAEGELRWINDLIVRMKENA